MKFLINTFTGWNEPPRCRHQVATELAKRYQVVFVEQNKVGAPKIEIIQENETLIRVKPYWPLDYRLRYRIPLLNEMFQEYLFKRVKKLFILGKEEDWQIINFDFTASRLINFFSTNNITYYCNDDFIGNAEFSPKIINKYHEKVEKIVIKNSGNCVATSDYLYKKLISLNSNSHLIHLGAPEGIPNKYIQFRNDNKNKEVITVAYVGHMLPNKLAIEWIQECAGRKRLEFLLIGPENIEVKRYFENVSKVKLLGVKIGEDLYSTLSEVNVCIAPYTLEKINKGGTPNKLWLYLALGKPVVLTELPNIESWKFEDDIIYRTSSKEEFLHLIEKAFIRDTEKLFKKRIEIAQENSWPRRIDRLLQILDVGQSG